MVTAHTASSAVVPHDAPAWARAMRRFTDYLVIDFLGGPRPWKLAWVSIGLFAVNMIMKEASMSRFPGWAAYRKRTWWLIPFVL